MLNIRFVPAEPTGDFLVAAKPVEPTSPNQVMALVRMGADRTKAQFNNLAGRIEKSWNEIVSYDNNLRVETVENKEKKLCIVSFVAIITGRENGVYLPNVRFSLFFSSLPIFTVRYSYFHRSSPCQY